MNFAYSLPSIDLTKKFSKFEESLIIPASIKFEKNVSFPYSIFVIISFVYFFMVINYWAKKEIWIRAIARRADVVCIRS